MPAKCCQAYAMRVEKGSLVRGEDGRVLEATAAMNNKRAWSEQ